MKLRKVYTCPLELTHDMIKGKWKSIILWRLRLGNTSLAKLESDIQGITQKMLLEQLRELIEMGLAKKKVFDGYPLKVEYSLTHPRGERLLRALEIMQEVGIDYMLEHDMQEIVKNEDTHEKVGNVQQKEGVIY